MKIDQALSTGVRLVGLITILFAFAKLIYGFTGLFIDLYITEVSQELIFAQRFMNFLGVVFPLVLGIIGYYLMSSADKVVEKMVLSSPFEQDNAICSKNVFDCALKLLGLGFVVYSLIPIANGLTGLFYIQSLPSDMYVSGDRMLKIAGASIFPGLLLFITGAYFMFKGKWVKAIAFPAKGDD